MSSLYLLSSDFYDTLGHIHLHDATMQGLVFAKIPIEFVRKSGMNTWEFVSEIVEMLVDSTPGCPSVIKSASGAVVLPDAAPVEGHYLYLQQGARCLPSLNSHAEPL